LNKNVQLNGLHAKKIPNASQLSKTVKENAELPKAVGKHALQLREAKQQLMLPNVLKPTIV
jgi:hypothetical protein